MNDLRPRFHIARWLMMVLVMWLGATSVLAQPSLHFDQRLAQLWSDYLAAKAIADQDRQEAIVNTMQQLRTQNLGDIFQRPAYLFLEEGDRDLLLGNYDSARQEYLNAIEMNPHLWPAYTGLASVRRNQGAGFRQYFNLNIKGATEAFTPRNSFFFMEAILWWLQNIYRGIQLAIILLTLLVCTRRIPTFLMTLQHSLGQKFPHSFASVFAMGLLVSPLLLGAHPFLAALLYLVLFMPFLASKERTAAYIAIGLAILLALLNLMVANVNHARANKQLEAHLTQFVVGDLDDRIQYLENNTGTEELKNRSYLTLGLLYKSNRNLTAAFSYFSKIPVTSDFWPEAQVNLGNLRFSAKEYQEAIEYYRKATGPRPEMFTALFNLALANSRLGDHREAENLKEQAARVDESYERRTAVYENLQVADPLDAHAAYWPRMLGALRGGENSPTDRWYTKTDFVLPLILTILILLLALLHVSQRNPVLIALSCTKCGRIFFPSDSPNNKWCNQCVSIYIRKEDLPSEAKMKKVDDVARYAKRRRWLNRCLQLLIPGAKALNHGHPIGGWITLLVWSLLLIFIIVPVSAIEHASIAYLQSQIVTSITIAVAVVYWIFFGLLPVFQED